MSRGAGDEARRLEAEHHEEHIRQRITSRDHDYVGDAVLGAVDGGVTTLAVIAGAVGGGFGSQVVIVLGFAKLVADGFSMAASNFLRARSQHERIAKARETERHHIRRIPEGERREIREIYAGKGFDGEALDHIVETLSADEERWIDAMVTEEHGLPLEAPRPAIAAATTFGAFLVVGLVPLLPFLFPALALETAFLISAIVTAITFLGVGVLKGKALNRPLATSGVETLLVGGGAALLAYLVSYWLRMRYGAG